MTNILTILPLAFVMIAGPQIISAVFLATSLNWRKNSAAFLAGVLLTVTFFVSVAYFIAKGAQDAGSDSSKGSTGDAIDAVVLVLLLCLAAYVFLKRKQAEPPKWMGKLQDATPKFSFILGLLLLGIFPTDIITSTTVGAHVARNSGPWLDCVPFILLTLLLISLPALLVVVMGQRAKVFLPKVRDWMNTNSWIVSEIVIVFFIAITTDSLAGS